MGASSSSCAPNSSPPSACPMSATSGSASGSGKAFASAASGSACPMAPSATGKGGDQKSGGPCGSDADTDSAARPYDVYGREIDPANKMPFNPNQSPHPDQQKAISTDRVQSSIGKGNTDGQTWLYPSPQMFYNALKRKGKGQDVEETSMESVVAIHNNMNERTWRRVLEWERANAAPGAADPKLLRFLGRPDELTPKARILSMFGLRPEPFDRHDWTIQRADGETVRYVIDYYYDESKGEADTIPTLADNDKVKSIEFDARPALDSPSALFARVRMGFREALGSTADGSTGGAGASKNTSGSDAGAGNDHATPPPGTVVSKAAGDLLAMERKVQELCRPYHLALQRCDAKDETEDACAKAAIGLSLCMGRVLCPKEAAVLEENGDEKSFDAMNNCLQRFEEALGAHKKA